MTLHSEHLQQRMGWEKGLLFTAGAALARKNQMLMLLGWVVLARRGLLFERQQLNVHTHVVFLTCSLIARGFSVV